MRRKMRRAAESGRVRFYVVDKDAEIEPDLESFFDLMIQDIPVLKRDRHYKSLDSLVEKGFIQDFDFGENYKPKIENASKNK